MDQHPPDQLAVALEALRAARLTGAWPAVLLRLALDLCQGETGLVSDAAGVTLASHPAAPVPEGLREAAAAAQEAGALRTTRQGEATLFALPAMVTPGFGGPGAMGALVLGLVISSPLHAAITRERLLLLVALGNALEEGGRHGLGAVAAAALGAGFAASGREAGLHAAAAVVADALRLPRVVLGLERGGAIGPLGFSDQAVVARGSETARLTRAALGEALDGPETAGPAMAAWRARLPEQGVVFGAAAGVSLLLEGRAIEPGIAAALARSLAPLALARPARRRPPWRRGLLPAGAAALLLGAALLPCDAIVEAGFVLQPRVKYSVTAPLDSTLADSTVQPGDTVREGVTLLARLATREIELELSAAQAKAANERREADIARARGNPAQEQLAVLAAERTEAQVALLRHRLALAQIRAPADGVILAGDLRRSLGQAVTRGQLLFEIARPEALRAEILVPDEHVAEVAAGQPVLLSPAAEPERRIALTITRLVPMAEQIEGRTLFRAIAEGDAGALAGLRPGMEGKARITTGRTTWLWWAVGDAVRAVRARLWL